MFKRLVAIVMSGFNRDNRWQIWTQCLFPAEDEPTPSAPLRPSSNVLGSRRLSWPRSWVYPGEH
jgi:hypothetical protein